MRKRLSKLFGGKKKFEPLRRFASFVWAPAVMFFAVAVIVFAAISATVDRLAPLADQVTTETVAAHTDDGPRHPLTGERLNEALVKLPQVFGVMVENAADAWPLVGLDGAFLVIEAPVEGNIPRFVAFFSEEASVEKIGPVRSARPYYLDWNDTLDAVYAHVGGSPDALDLIRTFGTIDLNQFFQSEYFWRQTTGGRYAPHNVFTSMEELTRSLDELELDAPQYETWTYKDDAPVEEAKSIRIDWNSGSTYDVGWTYSAETNAYTREQGYSTMKLEDGSTITAKNVVILAMDIRSIDNADRKDIETIGEGDMMLVQDGRMILGRWKKESREDRMRFYDYEGNELAMNAGVTWMEIVEELASVETVE